MAFSLDQFYRLNRRALIWIILFALLYMMRDFFGLVFLTFMLAFFAGNLVRWGQRWLPLPRRVIVVMVYVVFVAAFATFVRFAVPGVSQQVRSLTDQTDQMKKSLATAKIRLVKDSPALNNLINAMIRSDLSEETLASAGVLAGEQEIFSLKKARDAKGALLGDQPLAQVLARPADYTTTVTTAAADCRVLDTRIKALQAEQDQVLLTEFLRKQAVHVTQQSLAMVSALYRATTVLLMSILFSFLISLDIGRLGRMIQGLRSSRLSDFYEEAAQPVVRFAYVLGRAFQAQAIIACINTVLTLIGMIALGIPSIAMLGMVVFLCGFIPVLGVIISSIGIFLVAINTGGLGLGLAVLGLVAVIHIIEAYVLNPMIYGHHMHLNPVLVLIILYIGHHLFPLWGMLLGVPVTYYLLHDVFGVSMSLESKADGQEGEPNEAGGPPAAATGTK